MTTTGTDSGRIRLGTRGSRLALTQSGQVAEALMAAGAPSEGSDARRDGLDIDLVTVRTDGDGDRTPLRQLGGVGVFAARLRHALLDGEVDLVVHSFKDLPTQRVEGLEVICVPPREDPHDALCARDGLTLAALPEGARVGTGSPRRAAQLLSIRPRQIIIYRVACLRIQDVVIADTIHFHIAFIDSRSHDCPVDDPLGAHDLPSDLIRILDPNIPTLRTGWRGTHNNDITT